MFVSKTYATQLEARIVELKDEVLALRRKNDELVERLLYKERVPQTAAKQKMEDMRSMEELMSQIDIFNDIDGGDISDSITLLDKESAKERNNIEEFSN